MPPRSWPEYHPSMPDDLRNTGSKKFVSGEAWLFKLGPISMIFRIVRVTGSTVSIDQVTGSDPKYSEFEIGSTFSRYCQRVCNKDGIMIEKKDLLIDTAISRAPDVCTCEDSHPHNEKGCLFGMCACKVAK